jgi:adenylate cyclase
MGVAHKYPGGAEVELSMLFVDVRGSTSLAERMSPVEFSRLLNRFYKAATDVLVKTDAFIDKFVGDEVIGLYLPLFAGPHHARAAILAAQGLLRITGHSDRAGAWLPIGVGVHTGIAYVGVVSGVEGAVTDVTALGDNVNITARLASKAGPGEALISEAAHASAGLNLEGLEHRQLGLKGKSEPVSVRVLQLAAG